MLELHLDFESASKVDLKKVGADVYSRHPTTRVLMLAYAYGEEKPKQWFPHEGPMPAELRAHITDPNVRKIAFNAAFEIAIFRNTLKIKVDPRQWRCVMVMALALGLPGKMETLVRDALKLKKEYWKDPAGDKLMRLFSFPSSKATHETHPVEFDAYADYNWQDVVAETRAYKIMLRFIENIDALFDGWVLDQKINATGLPVDYAFITAAKTLAAKAKETFLEIMLRRTGLRNPNSTQQLLPWLQERGYPYNSLAKGKAQIAIRENEKLTDEAKEILNLRFDSNKTSLAKFDAIERASFGGRLRGTFQYFGAAATGRWAGRILGQNMPRPWKHVEEFLAEAREMIADCDLDGLFGFFGKPLDCIVSSIRSAINSPEGKKFVVADLASIELVVIAWLTDCRFWLDVVRGGKDAYKAFAEQWLGVPYAEVTKPQRNLSKPPALGCFAADTEILTKRGWIPIIKVRLSDQVFDGVEFVSHDGVVPQGVKHTVEMHGVGVTPDHLILCGEDQWREAASVAQEGTYSSQATELATGLCSRLSSRVAPGTTDVSARIVGASTSFTEATLRAASRLVVSSAQAALRMTRAARSMAGSVLRPNTSSDCLTVSTPCGLVASGALGPTMTTRAEALSVGLRQLKSSFATRSRLTAGTTLNSTSTAATMTGTTSQATFDSSRAPTTNATDNTTSEFSTKAKTWSRKISIVGFARSIETRLRCCASYVRALLRSKLSPTSRNAEVPTFDVLNAGPRNRFVIRTNAGPMIAHNCGYRMGAGREIVNAKGDLEKIGLWGYGAGMGVDLTKDQCKEAVKVYRGLSPEIVSWWKMLEVAALECVNTGEAQRVGRLTFDMKAPFLRLRLPSGRCLHYCRPRIEQVEMEYEDEETGEVVKVKKIGLTYERVSQTSGKWVRRSNHGGRFIEQCLAPDCVILTVNGPKRIVDVCVDDLVWDGVEWVAHDGLAYRGERETISFGGAYITPDHEVLVDDKWREAQEVSYGQAASEIPRFIGQGFRVGDSVEVQRQHGLEVAVGDRLCVRSEADHAVVGSNEGEVLRLQECGDRVCSQDDSRHVQARGLHNLEINAGALLQPEAPILQGLRRTWHNGVQKVACCVSELLGRHGRHVDRGRGDRAEEQQPRLLESELRVGEPQDQHAQHQGEPGDRHAQRQDVALRGGRCVGGRQDHTGVSDRRGVADRAPVRPAGPVYDLKNAGPRNRFAVVGSDGRIFIAHNCVQAIARDLLAEGLRNADAAGFEVVGHYHDEILTLVDEDGDLGVSELVECMTRLPRWAEGLPCRAEGYEDSFYHK